MSNTIKQYLGTHFSLAWPSDGTVAPFPLAYISDWTYVSTSSVTDVASGENLAVTVNGDSGETGSSTLGGHRRWCDYHLNVFRFSSGFVCSAGLGSVRGHAVQKHKTTRKRHKSWLTADVKREIAFQTVIFLRPKMICLCTGTVTAIIVFRRKIHGSTRYIPDDRRTK